MIALDHVAVWTRNVYQSTLDITNATGLPNRDGGYFPGYGLGQKVIPIAPDVYIEVEGLVDLDMIRNHGSTRALLERNTVNGDCFMGWCLRSDSMSEMQRFAEHRKTQLLDSIPGGGKVDMAGKTLKSVHVPAAMDSWPIGRPNIYYVPNLSEHACSIPAQPWTGTAEPRGVASIEVGGTEVELAEWLGDVIHPSQFPFEIVYNGKSQGLHAITLSTSDGEKTLRLNPVVP